MTTEKVNKTNKHAKELELVIQAQSGSKKAEEVIIKSYDGLVYRIGKPYMYKIPEDDVMQLGRIGVFKAIHKYKTGKDTTFRTFVNYWIRSEIDAESRHINYRIDYVNELDEDKQGGPDSVFKQVVALEQSYTLQQLINTVLNETERDVINCRVFQDMTQQKTSDELKLTRKSVWVIENRAINKLKKSKKSKESKEVIHE